jgi:hypothetical protein
VRERALALHQAVHAVHRTGLARLVGALDDVGGAAHARALADPAVRVLLELYDHLPVDESKPPVGFVPLTDLKITRARQTDGERS